jgi:uncharacterized protein
MPSVKMCFDDPLILKLLQAIKAQYALDWQGIHGISHWARVWENGMRLAEETGANKEVVGYFALFHDARRHNEGRDRDHGRRGAELASRWRGELFDLDDEAFELLYFACVHHTDGLIEGDVSVQTCWDADRLDLGRVGIQPAAHRLCTDAAVESIEWANERARSFYFCEEMRRVWI